MTRRLDGPNIETSNVDLAGREVRQAEGLLTRSVNRRRLDEIDRLRGRTSGAGAARGSEQPEAADFSYTVSGQSIDEALTEFVMPSIPDPSILRRTASILQDCLVNLVPNLEGGDQLKNLASTLMRDEIEKHRDLLGRLREGGMET